MHTELSLSLHEEHALALRRRAMADVWRGADAVWARVQHDAAARLMRSAQRLQHRLRQHNEGRGLGA
jgi:hypothetical protein